MFSHEAELSSVLLKCGRSLEFVWSELLPQVRGYRADLSLLALTAGRFLLGIVTPILWKVQQKDRRKHL